MNKLNKIDFALVVCAKKCNPNGDPLIENRPRTDYNSFGEISDVCIKRKIRNRLQQEKENIFVQSQDDAQDECKSLSERYNKFLKKIDAKSEDLVKKHAKNGLMLELLDKFLLSKTQKVTNQKANQKQCVVRFQFKLQHQSTL